MSQMKKIKPGDLLRSLKETFPGIYRSKQGIFLGGVGEDELILAIAEPSESWLRVISRFGVTWVFCAGFRHA